jgi:coproporphyrinogen III oxidase-like Fe-S oxidoreductase
MMSAYVRRARTGQPAAGSLEEISGDSDFLRRKEGLMLGLRLAGGVLSSAFEEIRKTLPSTSALQLEDAFATGLLEETLAPAGAGAAPRVRLTRKGVLLSNEVFLALV